MKPTKLHYGDTGTTHATTHVDVEVDRRTGEVVACWFRCLALPFEVSEVSPSRVAQMHDLYDARMVDPVGLVAVDIVRGAP